MTAAVGNLCQKMEARGELVLTTGKVSDLRQLIGEVWDRWGKPSAIVCDRWRDSELRTVLSRAGWPKVPLITRGMGFRDGGEDVRGFRAAFLRGLVTPSRNLLLSAAMANPPGRSRIRRATANSRRARKVVVILEAVMMRQRAAVLAVALGWRKALQRQPDVVLRTAIV